MVSSMAKWLYWQYRNVGMVIEDSLLNTVSHECINEMKCGSLLA